VNAYGAWIADKRSTGNGDELEAFFEEGFAPMDVLRAWWSV
jgi:hypothetical protein